MGVFGPGHQRPKAAVLILLVTLCFAAACSGGDDTKDKTDSDGYRAALLTSGKAKPDLTLPDTSGVMFNLQQATEGYVTLVYVGYTKCPDMCPLHMSYIATALANMDPKLAERVKVVFITADPERDTPTVVREWLDNFSTSFIGLIPTAEQLGAVTTALGMNPIAHDDLGNGNYSVSHAAFVLAFDPNDNIAHIGFLGGMDLDIYDHDILKLAQEAKPRGG